MAQKPVAMISSTTRDLPDHRKAARDACLRQDFFPKMMEHLPPTPHDAVTLSRQLVDEAEVYVLILGVRYGEVPAGYDKSYTHLELDRAFERGIPVLVLMMDLERHPVRPVEMEVGPGAQRLEALREELRRRQGVGFFDSPESLRALLVDGLSDLRAQLGGEPAALHYVRRLPAPPQPYVAHPYTLLHTRNLVGRQVDLNALTDWVTDAGGAAADRVFVMTAIGGMGKSALTWKWFNEIAPQEMRPLSGRVWWSFYESDARYANFITRTLSYVTGESVEDLDRLNLPDQEDALLAILDEKPYLIVLDGLERLLIAYARPDAAFLADDDLDVATAHVVADRWALPASAASSFTGQSRLRHTVDQRVGAFLRRLTTVRASRILISTRLFPADLQTVTTAPIAGVSAYFLDGLSDDDAVALWRAFGVSGSRAELVHLFASFRNYPLLIRALAGEVARFRGSPGDFAAWRAANPSFDPNSLDLRLRNSHVLAHALRGLTAALARTLHVVAAFRMPATYHALRALLVGEGRPFATEPELDRALGELEDRGLLGWEKVANRYDLHPIVRAVAWSMLDAGDQRGIYRDLAGHFESLPMVADSEIASVDDLSGTIEHYHTLLALGHVADAFDIFENRLMDPLLELAVLGEVVKIAEAAVDAGAISVLGERSDLVEFITFLGWLQEMCGRPARALAACERAEAHMVDASWEEQALVALVRARALLATGQLVAAERTVRGPLADAAGADSVDEGMELLLSTFAVILATRGERWEALRWLRDHRLTDPVVAVLTESLVHEARIELQGGNVEVAARMCELFESTELNERGLLARVVGAGLRAQVASARGDDDEAGLILQDALSRARTGELVRAEAEVLLELGDWHLKRGDLAEARSCHQQAQSLVAHTELRLRRADALNLLSRIEQAAGAADRAVELAREAYRTAWCDGPPYAYQEGLDRARTTLRELGAAEPEDVPPPGVPSMPPLAVVPTTFLAALGELSSTGASTVNLTGVVARELRRWPEVSAFVHEIGHLDLDGDELNVVLRAVARQAGPQALVAALSHPRPAVRAEAVALLPDDDGFPDDLRVVARDDPAPLVRAGALRRLLDAGDRTVDIGALLALTHDPDPQTRLTALRTAGSHYLLPAAELYQRLRTDPDDRLRVALLADLFPLSSHDERDVLSSWASSAEAPHGSGPLSSQQWRVLLELAETDANERVRIHALTRLALDVHSFRIRDGRADRLQQALTTQVRTDPLGSGTARDRELSTWLPLLPAADRRLLVAAAARSDTSALHEFGLREAIRLAVASESSEDIQGACDLLRRESDPGVIQRVLPAGETPSWLVSLIKEFLGSEDPVRRRGATRVLPPSMPVDRAQWAALLADQDGMVRHNALRALAHRNGREHARLLSRDVDGLDPFLDPAEPITEAHLARVAALTATPEAEVRQWFADQAAHYHLRLAWLPPDPPPPDPPAEGTAR
ncbi:DUF4062 domain-containing protein [Micromonospora sp. FIMYZ51]|uniref:DUF4062 domain-containing protein n=1 Tax=Micromonospora sp. FIMYZ51 TaxID=3051832 RepID=UPI00311DA5EB